MLQLLVTASCPSTVFLQEEPGSDSSTSSHQIVIGSNKICPHHVHLLFLGWNKHLSTSLCTSCVPASKSPQCSSTGFAPLCRCLSCSGEPKTPVVVSQVPERGNHYFPPYAGHPPPNAVQDAAGLCHKGMLKTCDFLEVPNSPFLEPPNSSPALYTNQPPKFTLFPNLLRMLSSELLLKTNMTSIAMSPWVVLLRTSCQVSFVPVITTLRAQWLS